jgi:H+-translocating NAD(P) transhydrogenase subunit alpha
VSHASPVHVAAGHVAVLLPHPAGPGLMGFITIFVLAAFVGYEVVSKVPSILHTPLMSGSNAIHGIILVGTMLVLGQAHGAAQLTLGFLAVVLATLNVVGGFVVTDRMLHMFKPRSETKKASPEAPAQDDKPPS